ncbi:6-methylsalicylic acid synthase [Lentithecium fluviatile CBS 122367]|uniref:6-methylsalicylic acid synthase n=1 Tax=Lentithecium fluviatile CBS 122367 TaxID=1168545 RepID=A0A6G1IQH0_9PLEO|nr:6-methylsalicylic acid synthase [Lentithecium fluviatile CBS 122367]
MNKLELPPTPRSASTASETPSRTDDVAIVGMSCRTAGGNNNLEKLWQFLLEKQNASSEVPAKRWEPWLRRDPRNAKVIEKINRRGYFINDLENFDAAFFGISPKEAELMDPHQRLALELSWEALENSGIDPRTLAGSDTAVFMGVDSDDYSRLIMEDLPNVEAWSGIGTAYHGIPNRISYHLDLMGPSTAVDAACASSLVAIHLARQAIVTSESTVALCGGVNVMCAPGLTHMLDKAGALSPDGLCLSFDDDAHGYARGEGGAIIVLKKLASAMTDNDNILAVLKGSASAQDGKTNGIMAPNAKAQELVARQALRQAGDIDPLTIGYVEAHATSTSLGDPTEVSAIAKVYGVGRSKDAPCAIGSIKPNVGHLEAAAGAIGFVKAVLAVNKGELAPQTLLKKLNTRIDWENSGLNVVRTHTPWPKTSTLRRAATCSYGYGGSVSHTIIEQTPPAYTTARSFKKMDADEESGDAATLILSSFQEKRLASQATFLADWLAAEGRHENLKAITSTLAQRRAAHDYRVSFVVATHGEAIKALHDFADGSLGQWATSNRILGSTLRKDVVWVFSGHGAQWPDMGKRLLGDRAFYEVVASLEQTIQEEANFSPLSALKHGDIGDSDRIQVLTYLVQVGLTVLLKSKGIQPHAVIAGCLTPEQGALVVKGQADELGKRRDIVAAINSSPSSCVISGETAALEKYMTTLHTRGIRIFRVKTDIAFHSPMLERLVDPFACILSGVLSPRPASIPIYSSSAPDPRADGLRNTDYWIRNMIDPVRLKDAVEVASVDGYRIFLEVSTHPIVSHSIAETLAAQGLEDSATFGVMKRNEPAERSILHAVAQLHTLGAAVDFKKQLGTDHWATSVPGTPWVQKPYWKEVETGCTLSTQQHDVDKHTLLGQCLDVSDANTRIYTTILDDKTKPYPLVHPLGGTEIIPAAVYCNTFSQATGATILNELQLRVPTAMTADQREIQIIVQDDTARLSSRLKTLPASSHEPQHLWIDHSSCKWIKQGMSAFRKKFDIKSIKKRIGTVLPNGFAWEFLQKIGVSGIAFPWAVLEHYGNNKEMIVKMDMDPNSGSMNWDSQSWAPFLDAATSVGSSIFFSDPKMRIVSGIDQVQFVSDRSPPKLGYLYIQDANDDKSLAADISVLDQEGELLAKLQSMRFSDVGVVSDRTTGVDALVHRLAWVVPAFTEDPLSLDNVLLVSDDVGLVQTYTNDLRPYTRTLEHVSSVNAFEGAVLHFINQQPAVVIYLPGHVQSSDQVPEKAHAFTWEATRILIIMATRDVPAKLFVITENVQKGMSPTAWAQSPLHGFARIAAQEHPELWGGLIDNEGSHAPLLALKYVQEQDLVRIQDGLPRVARLRPFTNHQRHEVGSPKTLLPKLHGTYIVTGGFGGIGLEILGFLVLKGARRIVVASRRRLPPRSTWSQATGQQKLIVDKIQELEMKGASIHGIALDIGTPGAHIHIKEALDRLCLPPVLGVIHAAGIKEDALLKDTAADSFARVFSPKVAGTLTLHRAFPPNTLDFFILFSSIGQLVGTAGQAPYGAANAFLDVIATHRRQQGDNAIAFQWTAWRNMGLVAGDPEFLNVELSSKGITDITRDEGFQAWEHISDYDTDHAVVTRARVLDANELIPFPLVAEIAPRRPPTSSTSTSPSDSTSVASKPKSGPELKEYITAQVKQCLSTVLHLDVEDIDTRAVVADLGVDSVMMGALRWEMQKVLGLKVPPTLVWKAGTVVVLVDWAYEKVAEGV